MFDHSNFHAGFGSIEEKLQFSSDFHNSKTFRSSWLNLMTQLSNYQLFCSSKLKVTKSLFLICLVQADQRFLQKNQVSVQVSGSPHGNYNYQVIHFLFQDLNFCSQIHRFSHGLFLLLEALKKSYDRNVQKLTFLRRIVV